MAYTKRKTSPKTNVQEKVLIKFCCNDCARLAEITLREAGIRLLLVAYDDVGLMNTNDADKAKKVLRKSSFNTEMFKIND